MSDPPLLLPPHRPRPPAAPTAKASPAGDPSLSSSHPIAPHPPAVPRPRRSPRYLSTSASAPSPLSCSSPTAISSCSPRCPSRRRTGSARRRPAPMGGQQGPRPLPVPPRMGVRATQQPATTVSQLCARSARRNAQTENQGAAGAPTMARTRLPLPSTRIINEGARDGRLRRSTP